MKRVKGCLGVFLIFVFGAIVGAAIASSALLKKVRAVVEGGPDAVVGVIVDRLKEELKLDTTQQEMLHKIALDTRIKLRGIRQETQPQVEQTLTDAEAEIRKILTPSQAKKFDEIVKRGRTKWKDE